MLGEPFGLGFTVEVTGNQIGFGRKSTLCGLSNAHAWIRFLHARSNEQDRHGRRFSKWY
jgi:hypothetical protein